MYLTLLLLPGIHSSRAHVTGGQMKCVPVGVSITTRNIERYELCAESYCQIKEHPHGNETILFPPELLLYDHHVQLKLFDEPKPEPRNLVFTRVVLRGFARPTCSVRNTRLELLLRQ